jgi:branched-chain amino acid transport system substrate-binding protein
MSSRANAICGGAAVIGLALCLTACSSSSKSNSTGVQSDGPKLTKSTIQIGVPVAGSGVLGQASKQSSDVAKAWAAWVNNTGGINGHPVQVTVSDTKGDTATAFSVSTALVTQTKVIAAVGGTDSGTEATWTKVFADAKVPVIGGSLAVDADATSSPYVFAIGPTNIAASKLTIDQAKKNGAKKISAVVCAEVAACAQAAKIWQPRTVAAGMAWGGLTQVSASDPSYAAPCLLLKSSGADFVILGVTAGVLPKIVRDCAAQGATFGYYGLISSSIDSQTLTPISKKYPSATFNLANAGFQWWGDTPAIKQYMSVMTQYGGKKDYKPNQNQQTTWTSLELFRKAMANASDNPTSEEVQTAMDNVKDEDLDGLLPQKITYTAGQPSKLVTCLFNGSLKDGVFSGSGTTCLTPSS